MARSDIFELEDFPWFPSNLRDGLTDLLVLYHRLLGTPQSWSDKLVYLIEKTGHKKIVDLCSGAGGPWRELLPVLNAKAGERIELTLTDLYPHHSAAAHLPAGASYYPTSVDAAQVPAELSGIRTMSASFHHMPPTVARSILAGAFYDRAPVAIFEITAQSTILAALHAISAPAVMALVPFTQPDARRLFFTYVFPALPAVAAWDGFASNLRTYTPDEMAAMTQDLHASDYKWEIGEMPHPWVPVDLPYLLGYPL